MLRVFFKSAFFKSAAHVQRHLEYLDKQGPLFDGTREVNVTKAKEAALQYPAAIKWWFVYSLTREDQQRLQIDRDYWQQLMEAQKASWAKAYNIPPDRLHICASFHDVAHHPHIHVVLHGETASDGYIVHRDGQDLGQAFRRCRETVKSGITNEVYRSDTRHLKEEKSAQRQTMNAQLEKLLLEIGRTSHPVPEEVKQKLAALGHRLEQLPGKHQYGYLPADMKAQVDDLLAALVAADRQLGQLYDAYRQTQKALVEYEYVGKKDTLARKTAEWEQAFFHPSKGGDTRRHNLIIQAAEAYAGVAALPQPMPPEERQQETAPSIQPPTPEMRALMNSVRAKLERRLEKNAAFRAAFGQKLLEISSRLNPTAEYRYNTLPSDCAAQVDSVVATLLQQPQVCRLLQKARCTQPDMSVLREWVTEYACAATQEQPVDPTIPQKRRARYKFLCAFDKSVCCMLNNPKVREGCLELAEKCLPTTPEQAKGEEGKKAERLSYWKLDKEARTALDAWTASLADIDPALAAAVGETAATFGNSDWFSAQLEKGRFQNIVLERLDEWSKAPEKPIDPKYVDRYKPKTLDAAARNLLYFTAATLRDDVTHAQSRLPCHRPAKKFRRKRIHHSTLEERAQDARNY